MYTRTLAVKYSDTWGFTATPVDRLLFSRLCFSAMCLTGTDVKLYVVASNGVELKMAMAETYRKLRIFVASPSDVASERARVATVSASLKPLADHIGLSLEVIDWHQAVPDMGRPQQIIFDQLQPTTWDLFIGILWHRFGTRPDATNPITQQVYEGGTEEEFVTVYSLWQQFHRPRIMMYRCMRQVSLDALDPDQFKRIKDFFAQFDATQGAYPGLPGAFDTTDAFETLLIDHLQKLLLAYSEQEQQQRVSREKVEALVPSRYPDNLPRRDQFFGRDKAIEDVLRALSPDDRGWGVVIDGIGGIGKTALAIEVAHRCKQGRMFNGFIFVSAKKDRLEPTGIKVQQSAATTLDGFIDETAYELGQMGMTQLTGAAKWRALLEALRATRTLLIYDNLETLPPQEQEAMSDLLRKLPEGCKAIATSRRRGGEGAVWLRLEKLDWGTACALIAHEAKREARLATTMQNVGTKKWRELYEEAGGSPLALIWTLGLIRARFMTFNQALALLRSGGSQRSPLYVFIYKQTRKNLGANAVAALYALTFFPQSASFEALQAVSGLTRMALETALEPLIALSLVDIMPGEERYALHPLTRNFILAELKATPHKERAVQTRFDEYARTLEVIHERGER